MLTPKRNGPDGDFFSGLSHRRPGEAAADWGRKPLSYRLRQARERRKLSLQDVARLTRIPVKSLYLLEGAEDKRLLAEPLSLISSLRRYAAFLNLTPDAAVAQFITELERLPAVEEEASRDAHPTQLLTHMPRPQSRVGPRTLFLLLALGLLAVVGSYSVLRQEQRPNADKSTSFPPPSAPPPQSGTLPPVSSPARSASSPDADQSQPSALLPAVSPSVAAAPPAEPPSSSLHHLRIQAKAKTWLHVTIDDQPMKRLFLLPGRSLEWSAEKGFTLSLGNAGAVKLILDGHELPPLGKAGQMALNVRLPS
jgi:cytoskeleton protein RodZ